MSKRKSEKGKKRKKSRKKKGSDEKTEIEANYPDQSGDKMFDLEVGSKANPDIDFKLSNRTLGEMSSECGKQFKAVKKAFKSAKGALYAGLQEVYYTGLCNSDRIEEVRGLALNYKLDTKLKSGVFHLLLRIHLRDDPAGEKKASVYSLALRYLHYRGVGPDDVVAELNNGGIRRCSEMMGAIIRETESAEAREPEDDAGVSLDAKLDSEETTVAVHLPKTGLVEGKNHFIVCSENSRMLNTYKVFWDSDSREIGPRHCDEAIPDELIKNLFAKWIKAKMATK